MVKADKYSGLVTALFVLVAVFYIDGEYDKWDIFLGIIGFALGMKYAVAVDGLDLFFTFLTSSLISIGFVAVVYGIIELSSDMPCAVSQKVFESSFIVFISLTLLLTAFMHISKRKEPEQEQEKEQEPERAPEKEPKWNPLEKEGNA